MSRFKLGLTMLAIIFSISFAGKNPYMTSGTEEFGNITGKILSVWNINSYVRNDRGEQMNSVYKEASVEFIPMKKDGGKGVIIWIFHLSDSIINERAKEERAKDSQMKIDDFIIKLKGQWDILDNDPKLIRITKGNPVFEISGSGTEFSNFIKRQNSLKLGAELLSGIGSVLGFLASKSMKSEAGLNDIIAELPCNMEFTLKGNTLNLKGNRNLLFKASN